MAKPPRVVNDAQVDRLLAAMKADLKYRQQLARRVVEKEGLKPGSKEYKRRYDSTMRRFQRYITEAGERRAFTKAPKEKQREVRAEARAVPVPVEKIERARLPVQEDYEQRAVTRYVTFEPHLNDLRAIYAFHDANLDELGDRLGLDLRGRQLVDFAVSGEGVNVFAMQGGGVLQDAIRLFYDDLSEDEYQDIQDFHDLLMDLPNWQIGMILGDIEDGETTFADWIDAWHNDGMSLEAETSEYWRLWRAAYARAKAA